MSRVVNLGITTPPKKGFKEVGWTISLPNNSLIPVRVLRGHKILWSRATPSQQYHYLIETYIPTVVYPWVENAECHFEINKNGNVHCHILAYIECPDGHEDYELSAIRKTINQNRLVLSLCGKYKNTIHMNYIHYLDDVKEWVKYIKKDDEKSPMASILYNKV